jgi:phage gp45-like
MRGVIQNLTRTEAIQNIQQSLLQQESPRSKERTKKLSIDM